MQIQLSVHLALGGVGLCLRPAKVGPTTCICSGGPGERSSFVLLGKSEAGIRSFIYKAILFLLLYLLPHASLIDFNLLSSLEY